MSGDVINLRMKRGNRKTVYKLHRECKIYIFT